jgi:hypothetical protein
MRCFSLILKKAIGSGHNDLTGYRHEMPNLLHQKRLKPAEVFSEFDALFFSFHKCL